MDGGSPIPPEPPENTFVPLSTYASAYGNGIPQSANFNLFRVSNDNCTFNLLESLSDTENRYSVANGLLADTLIATLKSRGFRIMFSPLAFTNFNTSPEFRTQTKKYIKYVVDCYGADVDFWDVVNEGDSYQLNNGFLSDIAMYIKSIDPYSHPLTSSFSPGFGAQDFPEADFTSPHIYADENEFTSDTFVRDVNNLYKPLNKPILWGESGNLTNNSAGPSALRMRIRAWTSFFTEGSLLFWNASSRQDIMAPPGVANQYIGQTERNYMRYLQTYTNNFPAATPAALQVNDPSTIRGYALSAPNIYGAYIHAYTNHAMPTTDKIVYIEPTFSGIATWINPTTGANVGLSFNVSPSTKKLIVPSFTTDIALKVVCSRFCF